MLARFRPSPRCRARLVGGRSLRGLAAVYNNVLLVIVALVFRCNAFSEPVPATMEAEEIRWLDGGGSPSAWTRPPQLAARCASALRPVLGPAQVGTVCWQEHRRAPLHDGLGGCRAERPAGPDGRVSAARAEGVDGERFRCRSLAARGHRRRRACVRAVPAPQPPRWRSFGPSGSTSRDPCWSAPVPALRFSCARGLLLSRARAAIW